MRSKTIFEKIIDREIPADIVYEDSHLIAFKDIAPRAPVHLLIVPKQWVPTLNEATEETLSRLLSRARKLAKQLDLAEQGYRVVINCNADAGQEVYHLHVHLLGGKPLGPIG